MTPLETALLFVKPFTRNGGIFIIAILAVIFGGMILVSLLARIDNTHIWWTFAVLLISLSLGAGIRKLSNKVGNRAKSAQKLLNLEDNDLSDFSITKPHPTSFCDLYRTKR